MICWINGQLVDSRTASISVLDHGFTVGDGVFETLLVRGGVPFARDLHMDRLRSSLAGLGITNFNNETIESGITQVLDQIPNLHDHRLRITVTSGQGPLGSGRGAHECTYVVTAAPANSWPASADVLLVDYTRNPKSAIAGLKTTSYAENVIALSQASARGCSEALFLDISAKVSEGTGSNIFWTDGTTLFTPSVQTGLLQGITRALVIHWASDWSIPVAIGEFELEHLLAAESAFLVSSTRDIQPIDNLLSSDETIRKSYVTSDFLSSLQTQFRDRMNTETNPTVTWQV